MIFDGRRPRLRRARSARSSRGCTSCPRYRQRLAVRARSGRAARVWVDDPHFNAALPHPPHRAARARAATSELQAPRRAASSPSALDRTKPLWEIWLVEGLDDDRFALISKTHHALVDGVSRRRHRLRALRHRARPGAARRRPPATWLPRPVPDRRRSCWPRRCSSARPSRPRPSRGCAALDARAAPGRRAAGRRRLAGSARWPPPACSPAPPLAAERRRSGRTGATRGSTPTSGAFKAIKYGAGRHGQRRRADRGRARARALAARPRRATPTASSCAAMVPVSVRADDRARARWATASRRCGRRCRSASSDPAELLRRACTRRCAGSRSPARPSAPQTLTQLADFAPPTILSQAARLQARQRFFNLVVTNVPGPQFPLYLLGPPHARASTPSSRWPRTRRWASRS